MNPTYTIVVQCGTAVDTLYRPTPFEMSRRIFVTSLSILHPSFEYAGLPLRHLTRFLTMFISGRSFSTKAWPELAHSDWTTTRRRMLGRCSCRVVTIYQS